jgi:hypothetical protein
VFFIQSDLLFCRLPERDEVQNLSLIVFSDLKYDGIQPIAHPTDRRKLLRNVGSSIEPIRLGEQLPGLLEPYASARILPQSFAFLQVEAKTNLI